MKIKYLYNGTMVSVLRELEDGFLVRNVLGEEYDYYEDDLAYFVDRVYNSKSRAKTYSKTIVKLKSKIAQLNKEIKLLRAERDRLQGQIVKIKQPKISNF